jgi:hypothetical protein
MNEPLNPDFVLRPVFWTGKIEPSESWEENTEDELFNNIKQQKGWNYRYRVRILGWHTGDKTILPSDQCITAIVKLPVTAGSGLGGCFETPALTAGSYVTGYFEDGLNGQKAVIDGVLINPNNDVPQNQGTSAISGFDLFNDTYREGSPERGSFVPDYFITTDSTWV